MCFYLNLRTFFSLTSISATNVVMNFNQGSSAGIYYHSLCNVFLDFEKWSVFAPVFYLMVPSEAFLVKMLFNMLPFFNHLWNPGSEVSDNKLNLEINALWELLHCLQRAHQISVLVYQHTINVYQWRRMYHITSGYLHSFLKSLFISFEKSEAE